MTQSQSTEPEGINPFNCTDCDKTCISRSELDIHGTEHNGIVPPSCLSCKKKFSNTLALDLHQQKSFCHLEDRRRHICTICRRAYHCASTLALHQRVHFIPRPFACTLCTASFSTRRTLTRHLQAHNHWEIPRCYLCGLVFSQQSTLRTHEFLLRCVYPHNCNICGQKFSLRAQLRKHESRHKTMLNGPFKCGICDKEFFLRKTLIVHWRQHMAGPTFSCCFCPKAFYLKTRLTRHLRSHISPDTSEDLKKMKEKSNPENATNKTPQEDPLNSATSCEDKSEDTCYEATPLGVIMSRKSSIDENQSVPRIYRRIPSGTNSNIYIEVGTTEMPGLETPQVKSGKVNMAYEQVVSRVKDMIVKKTTTDSTINGEKDGATMKAEQTESPSFQCNICKKIFARNASLKAHQRFHYCSNSGGSSSTSGSTSGEPMSSSSVSAQEPTLIPQSFGPFPHSSSSMKIIVACSRCGERNFKSLEELERHVCLDPKSKDHTCHICGKNFKFRCRLTAHILKHEQVKPCRVPCL